MNRTLKKIFSTLVVVVMCFTCTATVFADDLQDGGKKNQNSNPKEIVELIPENAVFVTDDDEQVITVDLVEKDTLTRATKIVGKAKFRVFWHSLPRDFEGQWSITLTNKDKIKKVTGTMNVRKDRFGPFNPLMTTMKVNKKYSTGPLYSNAEDVVFGDYDGVKFNEIYSNTAIILEWENFLVYGLEKTYYVTDGRRCGKIYDLDRYPN